MKKIMIIALAAVFATSAYAQNPEALKQIKKCKTFADAQALVKANESSMTAAENAQAYNKLVDIAYGKASAAQATIQTNQAMAQMGGEAKPVDMKAFYSDLYDALDAALACDKYDVQPNDKGKVAPKFRKSNADRLVGMRIQSVVAAQEAQSADPSDNVLAAKYYGIYAETGAAEMFKAAIAEKEKTAPDGVDVDEVARVAALISLGNKDYAAANKYADVMMSVAKNLDEALNVKMYVIEQNQITRQDSLNCLAQLKDLYAKYPANGEVFTQVASYLGNLGMAAEQTEIVNARIKTYPDSYGAWALKGQNEMNDKKYDEAIADFKKAAECTVEDEKVKALVLFYVGYCYQAKAGVDDKMSYEDQLALVKQGLPYLEKAREIDPNQERATWGYTLYNSYYNVYGENDPKTTALKAELGY